MVRRVLKLKKRRLNYDTHDRYFLDRVTNKIIELDRGNLYLYEGNYSDFLEKKAERLQVEASKEEKRQKLILKELKWVRRGAKARLLSKKQGFKDLMS